MLVDILSGLKVPTLLGIGAGTELDVTGNYWRHYMSHKMYKCRFKTACKGASTSKDSTWNNNAATLPTPCKEGYTGPLCAVCADGYALASTYCVKCDGFKPSVQFILFLLGMMIVVAVACKFAYDKWFGGGDGEKKVQSTAALKILMKKKKTLARLIAISGQVKVLIAYFQVTNTSMHSAGSSLCLRLSSASCLVDLQNIPKTLDS